MLWPWAILRVLLERPWDWLLRLWLSNRDHETAAIEVLIYSLEAVSVLVEGLRMRVKRQWEYPSGVSVGSAGVSFEIETVLVPMPILVVKVSIEVWEFCHCQQFFTDCFYGFLVVSMHLRYFYHHQGTNLSTFIILLWNFQNSSWMWQNNGRTCCNVRFYFYFVYGRYV